METTNVFDPGHLISAPDIKNSASAKRTRFSNLLIIAGLAATMVAGLVFILAQLHANHLL